MKKQEVTGKKVAAIAGRVLRNISKLHDYDQQQCGWYYDALGTKNENPVWIISFADLKALCASALTQAPDRPKRKK